MKNIIVDIGGCDSPEKLIGGVAESAKKHDSYGFVFVGDADFINSHLPSGLANVSVEHAPSVITNDDSPTHALRHKTDSSLVRAFDILNGSDDSIGLLSCGSTGAVLTGATLLVGRMKGVHRPVLPAVMPTSVPGKIVCVADSGANVDTKPEFMAQFAIMATEYVKAAFGVENPVVGLLSVGTEDKKGDERTKAAHALLKELPINFVGNMEARDALTGEYDVIICDGFAGNVLVKSTEGTAKMVMGKVKEAIMSSLKAKIGALFMKKALSSLKSSMNYHSYGGAAFLGVKKIVVKGHGSSNEISAAASVDGIVSLHENKVLETIEASIAGSTESKSDSAL